MLGLLSTMVFGLVVGAVAKLVMPGRDPGGLLITMLLGMAGAVLGGFVGRLLGLYGGGESAGFIMATLGAIAILTIYRKFFRKQKPA